MTATHGAADLGLITGPTWNISSFFRWGWRGFQEWYKRARMRAALCRLKDHELKDIGIMRGEIEHLVSNGSDAMNWDGRYRGGG